jgi:Ca2+-transporting ATPase
LTINVSALAIMFLGVLFFGVKAPFTVLQLLWINVIMDTFASIALCSEPPRPGVMKLPPKKRDENIVTPAMTRTIFITAGFFIVVMLLLLISMKYGFLQERGHGELSVEVAGTRIPVAPDDPKLNKREQGEWTFAGHSATLKFTSFEWMYEGQPATVMFTVYQVSLFFSIYVFFQVWNQINARSLTPDMSGFDRIFQNPTFLAIAGTVAVGQVLIVTFGGNVFKVEALGLVDWLCVIAFTSTVLIFAEVARRLRRAQP